jgi:hypothetical protein
LHIFPEINHSRRLRISLNDAWLNRGKRLSDLSQLSKVVMEVLCAKRDKLRNSHRLARQ